jgi:hypothetical protein
MLHLEGAAAVQKYCVDTKGEVVDRVEGEVVHFAVTAGNVPKEKVFKEAVDVKSLKGVLSR